VGLAGGGARRPVPEREEEELPPTKPGRVEDEFEAPKLTPMAGLSVE